MTLKLQATLPASGIEWAASRNHIPCMAHVIQLELGAYMRSPSVKGRTKSSEDHEHDQQFGDNESLDIGNSQRLRKEGNARIYEVSAMRPGIARMIEKVRISTYFESPETDLHIAENACCIDYADTWSLKPVHWMSKSQSPDCSAMHYGCEHTLGLETGVAGAHLSIMRIHIQMVPQSEILWLPASLHTTWWMDHCDVHHGSFEAIPIVDPVDVKQAYSHIASRNHSLQWHTQSYGWRYASFG